MTLIDNSDLINTEKRVRKTVLPSEPPEILINRID